MILHMSDWLRPGGDGVAIWAAKRNRMPAEAQPATLVPYSLIDSIKSWRAERKGWGRKGERAYLSPFLRFVYLLTSGKKSV